MIKDLTRIFVLVAAVLAVFVLAGCGGKEVSRVETEEQIDLSGDWNDVDSRMVSAALTTQITMSSWVEDFRAENGRKPVLIVAPIKNKTSEHVAVKTLTNDLDRNFTNGGRVVMVATAEEREEIRGERADQQEFSSTESMKQWGREKGADFILIGELNLIVDQEGSEAVKFYQVDAYLVDIEDNTKVWAGFEKIKKYIGKSKYKS